MSRAGIPLLSKVQEDVTGQLPSQRLSGMMWTEPVNAFTVPDFAGLPDTYRTLDFEINHVLNNHAKAIVVSLYKIVQRFSQTTVVPVRLMYLSFLVQEREVWIEMPPRSVRDVVVNVQRMGRGKPVDFFDEVDELSEE